MNQPHAIDGHEMARTKRSVGSSRLMRIAPLPSARVISAPSTARIDCVNVVYDRVRGRARTHMPRRCRMDRFEGFADARASFFKALAKNQKREWFAEHKAEFEEGWNAP